MWKLEFGETCIHHHELGSFQYLKDSSDEISGDINERDLLILHNQDMCQYLEDLHNLWTSISQMINVWCYKIMPG